MHVAFQRKELKLTLMIVRRCPWRAQQLQQLWRPFEFKHLHSERAIRQDTRWPGWEVVVGIEVHAQIKSRRKLFSGQAIQTPRQTFIPVDTRSTYRRAHLQTRRKTQLVCHLLRCRIAWDTSCTYTPLFVSHISHRHVDIESGMRRTRRSNCHGPQRASPIALRV